MKVNFQKTHIFPMNLMILYNFNIDFTTLWGHFDVTLGLHGVYEGGLRSILGLNWLQARPSSSKIGPSCEEVGFECEALGM